MMCCYVIVTRGLTFQKKSAVLNLLMPTDPPKFDTLKTYLILNLKINQAGTLKDLNHLREWKKVPERAKLLLIWQK